MRASFRRLATRGSFNVGFRHPDTLELTPPNAKQLRAMPMRRRDGTLDWGADWLFYGGAAGGGKTAWLALLCVLYALAYPRSNIGIFRRKYKELEGSIILELLRIIPPGLATWSGDLMRFSFWNGSHIWCCHCQHEKDVYQYQSFQFGLLAVDEASHFTEFQVRYLITRLRQPLLLAPKLLRLGSNPGGPGHGWLKRWFVRPEAHSVPGGRLVLPLETWRPLPPPGVPVAPEDVPTRQFIPARFEDNFVLQQTDPHYLANIYQLGGDKAKQLAEGDWDANEAMIVGGHWRESYAITSLDHALLTAGLKVGQVLPWHVVPLPAWRPSPEARTWGSVDYGYGAPWAFYLHAGLTDGHTRTWHERYQTRLRDRQQAEQIRDDILHFTSKGVQKPEWLVCDPAMWNSRAEMGLSKSIAEVYREILGPIGVRLRQGAAGRGARVSRAQRWMDALSVAPDGLPWWSTTTACPHMIRTVPEVPWDEEDVEVEDDESENHAYESIGRFFEARPHAPRAAEKSPYAHLDPLSRREQERREAHRSGGVKRLTGFREV